MSLLGKIYRSVTFRCIGALALGLAAVTFIALELARISFDAEPPAESADNSADSRYIMPFPENEEMLRDMAQRMMLAEDYARVEPAAGAAKTPEPALTDTAAAGR